ncbi:hypothetical protein MmiAt1_11320 [Methanimicrococcus sp. At1]|uniref:CRISPR-associated helicase Cas3 n=2 Tax=Methanimicrococcus hacksteinii TaxID=3028293 RepID=A0ABU3VQ63_9EURY|nr:hypothetical protein [Methanimicrococcus sp. At1]
MWHDLGKFNPEWQTYLLKSNGEYEENEKEELDSNKIQVYKKIDHSIAGAIYCSKIASEQKIPFPKSEIVLGYLIAGHHTGLPDWDDCGSKGKTLPERIAEEEVFHHLDKALKGNIPDEILSVSFPKSSPCNMPISQEELHLWIRMLYSCLVDADYLDTEYFMSPNLTELRSQYKTLPELKELFGNYMIQKTSAANRSVVNEERQKILNECREKASLEPGLFTLTVPTGGGKTLSSMAFALEHALLYGKKRIIIAIPYTSIIEQTAAEYKKIFGSENVIEHHCNLEPEKETLQSKLATENWDAPIVVTTNVQLFESLFASKSSACRKLHNVSNSVIILDEAQTLPPEYLKPILMSVKSLSHCFKTSIVLCTATQPALTGNIGSEIATFKVFGEKDVREIIADPPSFFQAFQRVQIEVFGSLTSPPSWEEIAEKLIEYDQILCIVSSKTDCSDLYDLMPEGTIHLSGYMCSRHRSQIIQEIKLKLQQNLPVRVICTQIIEAGVDIDFPVVFRALSGLDRIAQAAGRCNREGKQTIGKVCVFKSPTKAPRGLLRKSEDSGFELYSYNPEKYTQLNPENFEIYFKNFYSKVNNFDQKEINELLIKNACLLKIQFRKASNEFKMIDDSNQYAVIVKYFDKFENNEFDEGQNSNKIYEKQSADVEKLIEKLRWGGPTKYLMRQLQGYAVIIYENQLEQMKRNGMIEEINGIYVQCSEHLYDSVKGLQVSEELKTDDFFV